LDEAVVASSGTDGILGAEVGAGKFECGEAIVIEASDEPWVDHRGNLKRLKACEDLIEVLARGRR
jgi:hypothetical protein